MYLGQFNDNENMLNNNKINIPKFQSNNNCFMESTDSPFKSFGSTNLYETTKLETESYISFNETKLLNVNNKDIKILNN
jgi:hypothetical protein